MQDAHRLWNVVEFKIQIFQAGKSWSCA